MIEWYLRAEGFPLDHPGWVILRDCAVSSCLTVSKIAGETVESAGLVIAVIYGMTRGVGHGLDVAGQIVGLLNIVTRPPIGPLPEVLPLLERSPERVVTIYRISRDISAHLLGAAFLRPIPVQTPSPIHRPIEDSGDIALL